MSSRQGRRGIFISYRREDTAAYAGRLYDNLSESFGEDRVFMDVDSIAIGVDFTKAIVQAVSGCNILLVLIGRDWLAATDNMGKRRIEDPNDWVRVEIETALRRDIRVVPILVDGAALPRSYDLPPSLRPFVQRQAFQLSHSGFRSEVARLTAAVYELLEAAAGRPGEVLRPPQRSSVTPPGRWKLEQVRRGTVRLSSGGETHDIAFGSGVLGQTILVDGKPAVVNFNLLSKFYPLTELSSIIGSDVSVKIEKRTFGLRWCDLKAITLKVGNQTLRQELDFDPKLL